MFEIIDQSQPTSNKGILDLFCEKITNATRLSSFFENHNESTCLIMKDESKGIIGGAILAKNKITSFEKRIAKSMPSAILQAKEAWTCTVFLHLENECLQADTECLEKEFYVNLYKSLSDFGHKAGIDYLSVILAPGEYLCTEVLGFWPYVVEVRPNESEDGLFHGLLSLLKNRPKSNPSTWEVYLSEYNRLAA